jgi:hypothetical protein
MALMMRDYFIRIDYLVPFVFIEYSVVYGSENSIKTKENTT